MFKSTTTVRVDAELLEWWRKERGTSLSGFIEQAIRREQGDRLLAPQDLPVMKCSACGVEANALVFKLRKGCPECAGNTFVLKVEEEGGV